MLGRASMRDRRLFLLMMVILFCTSCSVGMALSGTKATDTSVFYNGAERSFVQAKAGLPEVSIQDKDGNWIGTYLIVKGNEPSAGRAIGHGVMDVLTFGLWEVLGTPIEMVAGMEDKSRFIVYYNEDQKIVNVERIYIETPAVIGGDDVKDQPYPIDHSK